jgi:hypothetical protein
MYPPLWPKRSSIGLEALFPEALSKNVPSNGLIMAMGLEAAAAAAALLRLKNKHNKTEKSFSNIAASQFCFSRSNKSTTTLQF